MYKTYYTSCNFSTRPARGCSNRWMDCGRSVGFCDARSAGCGKTCAFAPLGARENRNTPLSVGFGNCQTRFDRNRWMDCGGRSGFATSTQQECTMYSTVAAQEQGARLPASRHRRLDFSQKNASITFCGRQFCPWSGRRGTFPSSRCHRAGSG